MPLSPITFDIQSSDYDRIFGLYQNTGKNSHIANWAVEIVKCYYLSIDPLAKFIPGKRGYDLEVESLGKREKFEIKGTAKDGIDWNSLRVSSEGNRDLLMSGMRLIRVCGIGSYKITLYYLEHGKHFTIVPEARFRIKRN